MSKLGATFWSPLALSVGSGASSIVMGARNGWTTTVVVAAGVCLLAIGFAYVAAKRAGRPDTADAAGAGGDARAKGTYSQAIGGDAGRGIGSGDGGRADALGRGAHAQGGRGGDS